MKIMRDINNIILPLVHVSPQYLLYGVCLVLNLERKMSLCTFPQNYKSLFSM